MSLEELLSKEITFLQENLELKGSYEIKKYVFRRKNFSIELYYGIKHKILTLNYNTKNNKYNIKVLYNDNTLEYITSLEEEKAKKLLLITKKLLEKSPTLEEIKSLLKNKVEKNFYYGYDIINKEHFEIFYYNTQNQETINYDSRSYNFTIEYNYKNKKYSVRGRIPVNIKSILEKEKVSDKNSFIQYYKLRIKRKINYLERTIRETLLE